MLDKIKLKNFKCYQEIDIELKGLNVLCGVNSSGKSAIIQAIAMFLQSEDENKLTFDGKLVNLGNYKDVHNHFICDDETLEITISIKNNSYTWSNNKNQEYLTINQDKTENLKTLKKQISNNYQFISAERLGPRNNYPFSSSRSSQYWLGTKGEYTAQVLSLLSNSTTFNNITRTQINDTSQESNNSDCLRDPRVHPKVNTNIIIRNIEAWLKEITPDIEISSQSIEEAVISYTSFSTEGTNYKPIHVGFGLSYAISIITALLCTNVGGIVIIENPEAHLHPRGQSYLGRLIAATAKSGVQVILETHSEHIINGIRVAIKLDKNYPTNLVQAYFIQKEKNSQPLINKLVFDNNAQLSQWPKGFFDQQIIDLKILMTGKEPEE
ncbi:hypothetical protein B6D17_06810 [Gilliamella apis]|uniref:DUF3696 domain-containing protein n=1 Tax=Gilliamella apis TaxID=1970738 RepID=UPI000A346E41|nr:DUF3696 domain-containing protein [Gilliamella apis]OTQ71021.1 hypothetical protein B6D17_06810 [Gilliamella apis]OTQ72745.1 hypothetical protein B6C90_10850 [Gilliamella apis]